MNAETHKPPPGLEVCTYFVRERNALIARADFGELYVDYYLHQGQYGFQHEPAHDGMMKEALAGLTLHCASRPRNETSAWTIHFQEPLLNLFVTGNNQLGTVVGQIFTEEVKDTGQNLFLSDVVRGQTPERRSAVEFEGNQPFQAIERYYAQSEQRPARYFRFGPEEFVMVSAQPGCDMAWFEALNDESVRLMDQVETLSLLEQRNYRFECGCTQSRMLAVLAPIMRTDPEGLFGDEPLIRISCPRCGARHTITREALEAFVAASGKEA
jgi:molecular chaperone Hsp33